MKKFIICLLAMFMVVLSSNAQVAYQKAKLLDNTYVGVQGGVNTPLSFNQVFPLNEYAGIRVGKDLTPIFGLNVDAGVYFNNHSNYHHNGFVNHFSNGKTVVDAVNVGLNGTINLSNLFFDYKGTPRIFEVATVTGLGWSHVYDAFDNDDDELTSKAGLDFNFNLGNKKAWIVYVEPAVVWNLTNDNTNAVTFDKSHAYLQLLAGVTYKFKTSNGTHNFKLYNIGELNDKINSLRSELSKKPKTVVKTVEKVVDNSEYVVFFAKGSDKLSSDAKTTLNSVKGSVKVYGYASPEGTSEFNQKLSDRRAETVAEYLRNNGVNVTIVKGMGVAGITSNRVVIVK